MMKVPSSQLILTTNTNEVLRRCLTCHQRFMIQWTLEYLWRPARVDVVEAEVGQVVGSLGRSHGPAPGQHQHHFKKLQTKTLTRLHYITNQ